MKIFEKKYDIKKNQLHMEFDIETGSYQLYQGLGDNKHLIPLEKLNLSSLRYLKKQNEFLKANYYRYQDAYEEAYKKIYIEQRVKEFNKAGIYPDSFEYLGQDESLVDEEYEVFINDIISEKEDIIGIHRVGPFLTQDDKIDIFTHGLIVNGHMFGATDIQKDINHTISFYYENSTIKKEIAYAQAYKNSIGSIIVKFSIEDYINNNITYIDNDGITRIKPEFIICYIPTNEDHIINSIEFKEDIIKNIR